MIFIGNDAISSKSKLQRIRECIGVSPEEIIRNTEISYSAYRQNETGKTRPKSRTRSEIIRGLNATLSSEKRRKLRNAGLLCGDAFTEQVVFPS